MFLSSVIRVLPSVFAKMGGQFPSCATIEPLVEGSSWQKFMNNDGIEIGDGQEDFRLKSLAFPHWNIISLVASYLFVTCKVS